MAVTFDRPSAWFVSEQDVGASPGSLLYQGTTLNVAAAPTGDSTVYQAVSPGESVTFSFGPVTPLIRTISFYLGSNDAYNTIYILGPKNRILGTIRGNQWPGDDGDQQAAATNRRAYITNLPPDFYGIEFVSTGIAEEYDDIAVSNAVPCFTNTPPCVVDGGVYPSMPLHPAPRPQPIPGQPPLAPIQAALSPLAVPEPAAWSLMLSGLGLVGSALRARRRPAFEPS